MQSLLEALNLQAAAVDTSINASKVKVMSALIPGEQHQAALLDGEPLRVWTNSSTSARCSSQTVRAPRRSDAGLILFVPHSLVYNPVFGRGMRMLEVFANDSIRRILHVGRRDCVPPVELSRRLSLTSIPALLVQRRLHWFSHASRRP